MTARSTTASNAAQPWPGRAGAGRGGHRRDEQRAARVTEFASPRPGRSHGPAEPLARVGGRQGGEAGGRPDDGPPDDRAFLVVRFR